MIGDSQAILADFGRKLGLDEIAFDEDGNCKLDFDDVVLDIEHQRRTESLTVRSTVCEIPATVPDDYFAKIAELSLAGSMFGSAYLGVDPVAKNVVLIDHIAVRELDPAAFEKFMTAAVDLVEVWRELLTSREFSERRTNHLETMSEMNDMHGSFPIRV
jgi:Tir chaperone protein (CesT) family